jgi:single-strand DNA-binding protein
MFDTPVTIVGNLLTAPEWRRTTNTGTVLVTFKVASTSRRFDRDRNMWVDGDSLRLRVTCWRRLAENVSLSVQLGDPVVIFGRMYSRDWIDDEGNKRTSYEMDAMAVGHDLSRGVSKFARRRPAGPTDQLQDAASAVAVGGEITELMDNPERPDDLPPDNELFEPFDPEILDTTPIALPEENAAHEGSVSGAGAASPDVAVSGEQSAAAEEGRVLAGVGSGGGRSRSGSRSRGSGGAGPAA